MHALRALHRLAAWIAALALLLASMAPSWGHALGPAQAASWVEICTSQGSKWVTGQGDETPAAPAAGHVFEHCSFCSTHAPALGLPPTAGPAPRPGEGHGEFSPAFLAAPHARQPWVCALPRAPPQRA